MEAAALSPLERQLPRLSRSGALLQTLLVTRAVTLADMLPGPHVPRWPLDVARADAGGGGGKSLVAKIDGSIVASITLTPAVWRALGLRPDAPPALLDAAAAAALAPLWQPLRVLFGAPFELGIEELEGTQLPGPTGFGFTVFVPSCSTWLDCRVHERCVPRLLDAARRLVPPGRPPLALPLVLCLQRRLSLRQLRGLAPGDVLLDEPTPGDDGPHALLCTESIAAQGGAAQLARVRLSDGRIEHVGSAGWAAVPRAPAGPCVVLDVVLARLSLPMDRCRALQVGEQLEGWDQIDLSGAAQLQLAGQTLAELRRIRIAGVKGHEIISLGSAAQP